MGIAIDSRLSPCAVGGQINPGCGHIVACTNETFGRRTIVWMPSPAQPIEISNNTVTQGKAIAKLPVGIGLIPGGPLLLRQRIDESVFPVDGQYLIIDVCLVVIEISFAGQSTKIMIIGRRVGCGHGNQVSLQISLHFLKVLPVGGTGLSGQNRHGNCSLQRQTGGGNGRWSALARRNRIATAVIDKHSGASAMLVSGSAGGSAGLALHHGRMLLLFGGGAALILSVTLLGLACLLLLGTCLFLLGASLLLLLGTGLFLLGSHLLLLLGADLLLLSSPLLLLLSPDLLLLLLHSFLLSLASLVFLSAQSLFLLLSGSGRLPHFIFMLFLKLFLLGAHSLSLGSPLLGLSSPVYRGWSCGFLRSARIGTGQR